MGQVKTHIWALIVTESVEFRSRVLTRCSVYSLRGIAGLHGLLLGFFLMRDQISNLTLLRDTALIPAHNIILGSYTYQAHA